ncbi:TMEM165/GDT1 family protein [Cronbergia sp. UHCC 0137]|uniref:TMEM165/GDT1 family protein n=1 Tax=Cronbergia sp. UHCC 0137 TaxID=3110239 RepID=UPI002B1F7926|nr:TMEM165/GDT1 family protein [Cronbergia sp. UHCC 0137]MEA5617283.1 TMEM165/GDT1 family protein [Cronbergia sp. UHCC 0137]
MKLDSDPISISGTSQIESQLELEEIVVQDHSTKEDSILVVFGTTFLTIFLAEMGDKTQLSTLLMSAESHTPWVVFMGSGAALITTSLLSVLLGGWMASKFSPKTVEKSAGLMLLLISVMLVWDVIKG